MRTKKIAAVTAPADTRRECDKCTDDAPTLFFRQNKLYTVRLCDHCLAALVCSGEVLIELPEELVATLKRKEDK